MKLISFTVPAYNSEEYLEKCVNSLLPGGEDVEIIIVNDGSTDNTLAIARKLEAEYPKVIRIVDKPNGGHGSGVNAGLDIAEGLYFKVVDSDDWLDSSALAALLENIKVRLAEDTLPDLYITNFVYDHATDGTHISEYSGKMAENTLIGWEKVKSFRFSHMMLMHSLTYRTENLRESGVRLPEHTFYVDNLFAYAPLPHMRKLCYLNINLYHYFIGRADQSVNIKNIVARYAQQQRVMLLMTQAFSKREISRFPKGLKKYAWHSLKVIMMNTVFFTCAEDSPQRRQSMRELKKSIKLSDKRLYGKLRHGTYLAIIFLLPWRLRGRAMTAGYRYLCKKVKLG